MRLATENPTWSNQRIHDELTGLGHKIASSTVSQILRNNSMNPAPHRSKTTWTKFQHSQAAVACGSFTVDTATLRRYYILFFIHIETRQVFLAGQTANPSGALLRRNPVSLRQLGSSAWCGPDKQVHN